MKCSLRLIAPALALVTSCFQFSHAAAESAPSFVISIAQVDARDAGIYATQLAAINAVMKTKFGIDPLFRVYRGESAGVDSGAVFAVSRAESFAALMKNTQLYQTDPATAELRASLDSIRELGARTLLRAVRFDGANPNAWLYNTYASVSDEAGYLKAIAELRTLFDNHGLADAKINIYRVIAGRSDYTHLISINTPSPERLAALLDSVAAESWAMEWIAASAKFRTVVRNGTYREISR